MFSPSNSTPSTTAQTLPGTDDAVIGVEVDELVGPKSRLLVDHVHRTVENRALQLSARQKNVPFPALGLQRTAVVPVEDQSRTADGGPLLGLVVGGLGPLDLPRLAPVPDHAAVKILYLQGHPGGELQQLPGVVERLLPHVPRHLDSDEDRPGGHDEQEQ